MTSESQSEPWYRVRHIARELGSHAGLMALALAAITAAVAAVVVLAGTARTSAAAYDVLGLLDGGWRIYSGQRVFQDFWSTPGALEDYRMAAAIWLGGGATQGIAYMSAILTALIMVWSYVILQPRMNRFVCLLASLTLGLLVASPAPLGELVMDYSRGMEYNRLGYAVLALVVLELFQAPPEGNTLNEILGSATSGFILGALPFHKPTYFLICFAYVVFAAIFGLVRPRRLVWTAIAAAVTFGGLYVWMNPGMRLIEGYTGIKGSHHAQFRLSPVRIAGKMFLYQTDFWILAITGYLVGLAAESRLGPWEKWRNVLLAAMTYVSGIGLLTTNAQNYGLPISALVLLVFLSRAVSLIADDPKVDPGITGRIGQLIAIVLFATIYWMEPTMKDGMSLVLAPIDKREAARPPSDDFVAGLPGRDLAYKEAPEFVTFINDGVDLLRSTPKEECVVPLSYANPYAYLLGKRPCHGGRSFLAPEVWGDLSKVPDDVLIGDGPDLIMTVKEGGYHYRRCVPMNERFASLLQREYYLAGESKYWILHRKNSLRSHAIVATDVHETR